MSIISEKKHLEVFIVSYNMRILPYLCPCCGILAARFSNITTFECSHRRDAITYTHDIFQTKCKRPHHATRKFSNLYIENKYHLLTLQKKFRLLLNKGVCTSAWNQGLYSISGKTLYHQISWSLEAMTPNIIMIVSLWNLTGISTAKLPRGLSNVRGIRKV